MHVRVTRPRIRHALVLESTKNDGLRIVRRAQGVLRASDCQRRGEYRRELQRRRGGFVGERPLRIAREEALNQRGRRNKRVGETREQVSVGERRVEVSHHHFLQPPVLVFRELDDVVFEERRARVLPYWTIVVADDQTKAYIQEQAKEYPIDIFVDKSLHDALHKGSKNADADELKSMLSWRRVHALYTLVNADYTAVFLEPDVVFTGNPMQTIHDQLLDHDVVVSSDYGFKSAAKKTVNTKMIMAKPSKEAKKLLNVWQKAEASYRGEDAERGFLEEHVIPKLSELSAKIGVADQSVVQNYITHINKKKDKNTAFFVTGTGCPDVDFKLNFLNQISQLVMPISSSVQMTVDYESVAEGCDVETRKKILGLRHDANSAA